jgi:toxin ParE1/3/4
MRVTISGPALIDLVDIGRFVARDSRVSASRLVKRLRVAALSLGQSPERFAIVRRRSDEDIRRMATGTYSIFYVVRQNDVFVVRILHSARDIERFFPDAS